MPDSSSPAPGRRANGLPAADWGALVDLDPRLSEALLERLQAAGVAAYVEPARGVDTVSRAVTLPGRPLDRLWVDPDRAERAREVVASEVADLTALLAEAEPGATAHGLVQPVPRSAARHVLTPPALPLPPAAAPGLPHLPGAGLPDPGLPGNGPPGNGPPGAGLPSPGLPGDGGPGSGLPGRGLPGSGLPGDGVRGPGLPGNGLPGSGLPGSGLPGSGLPGSGLPGSGLPGNGLPASGRPGAGHPSRGVPGAGPPAGGSVPLPPAEPTEPLDDDAVFAQIVAGFSLDTVDPVPRWPAQEDLPVRPAPPADGPQLRRRTDPPSAPPPRAAPPPPARAAGQGVPGWPTPDPLEDDGHYEPPPPPPVPRLAARTVGAVLTLLLGLVVLFAPRLLHLSETRPVALLGLAMTAGGAAALIWWMRDSADDDGDDGAVV